jgi:hypothetical protein
MIKESSKERVRKWRSRLRKRGGRELKVTLEPQTAKLFDALKRVHKRKTSSQIIEMAINALARESRKPVREKKRRNHDTCRMPRVPQKAGR